MKYAVDSQRMKKIDDYTTGILGIPAMELMERAANKIAAKMIEKITKDDRILAVCGPGNNGGDGVAAGRILYLQGYQVAILFIGDETKCSVQLKAQLMQARNLGIPNLGTLMENCNKLSEYNIIIDAIFGVGLSKPVTGVYEDVIGLINESRNTVYSVDIPSGVSSDDGSIRNTAVRANETITFGPMKIGLLLYPGAEYAGQITVADIGFPEEAANRAKPDTFYYEAADLKRLPARYSYSHKGTYGKVLVIAGSKGMGGAAVLSAKAAYRGGTGLVKILSSKANRIIIQCAVPEALFAAYDDDIIEEAEWEKKVLAELSWASVIVIGPGLSLDSMAEKLLDTVLQHAKVPVILDADALTLLAGKLDARSRTEAGYSGDSKSETNRLQSRLNELKSYLPAQTILTPHLMELSRLLGVNISKITGHLIDTARQCTYNNELIFVLKDARTIVAGEQNYYINVSGNHGMATGGSGDTLTGILAAFLAQGMEPYGAACLGVYVHGLAGDAAAKEHGTYSMMAGDIIDSIGKVLIQLDSVNY